MDSCNTSDKGKGKGSLAVANTPVRSQASSKKGSGAPSQPQRKHKASLYYGRYKVSSPAAAVSTLVPSTEEEDRSPERTFQPHPETCCSLSNGADEAGPALPPAAEEKPACLEESRSHRAIEEKEQTHVMFPMETHSGFAESVSTAPPSPRPGPPACSPAERPPAQSEPTPERKEPRKRDVVEVGVPWRFSQEPERDSQSAIV